MPISSQVVNWCLNTVLEPGMTIRDVLKSAFQYLFEMEEKMNDICDHLLHIPICHLLN